MTKEQIDEIDCKWQENIPSIRPWLSPNFPTIVCLCGSTRFMEAFYEANMRLTLEGKIVLTVGMSSHGNYQPTEEQKQALDKLHFRKIELSDEILVLNVGGYIGQSTRNEIAHATKCGKIIRYLEKHE